MDDRKEKVRARLRKLIAVSCKFENNPSQHFRKFHKAYLKFFFGAIDVSVDYQSKTIAIWNSRPLTTNPLRLYNLNEAISDTVFYTNLEETLSGAIQEGLLEDSFYNNLLNEYGEFSDWNSNDDDVWSA